jgi:hypothetical protein
MQSIKTVELDRETWDEIFHLDEAVVYQPPTTGGPHVINQPPMLAVNRRDLVDRALLEHRPARHAGQVAHLDWAPSVRRSIGKTLSHLALAIVLACLALVVLICGGLVH